LQISINVHTLCNILRWNDLCDIPLAAPSHRSGSHKWTNSRNHTRINLPFTTNSCTATLIKYTHNTYYVYRTNTNTNYISRLNNICIKKSPCTNVLLFCFVLFVSSCRCIWAFLFVVAFVRLFICLFNCLIVYAYTRIHTYIHTYIRAPYTMNALLI
jgi:hypothetical protein